MGQVYVAIDRVLDRPVAVKVLLGHVISDTEFVARFFREAKIVASLSSNPHVVTIYDVGQTEDGAPYIVMEYLQGQDLRAYLREWSPPSRDWVLDVGKQVSSALLDAHAKGVVHRDLKPENVFQLRSHTLPFLVKVIDFGIARSTGVLEASGATVPGSMIGTPRYMAPEQVAGQATTGATDVYSLGLILYELATGAFPYAAQSPLEFMRAHVLDEPRPFPPLDSRQRYPYPPAFEHLVLRALAKAPSTRPSAHDMLRELARAESDLADMKR